MQLRTTDLMSEQLVGVCGVSDVCVVLDVRWGGEWSGVCVVLDEWGGVVSGVVCVCL